jgi:hypothetical protein
MRHAGRQRAGFERGLGKARAWRENKKQDQNRKTDSPHGQQLADMPGLVLYLREMA